MLIIRIIKKNISLILIRAISTFINQGRGQFSLGGPNVTTRILFFASISSLYLFSINKKLRYIVLTILFISSIVLVGSRGGIVGALVSYFTLFFVKKLSNPWKFKKKALLNIKKIRYIAIALAAFALVYDEVKSVFINRFLKLTFRSEEIYTAGRDVIYAEAIGFIKEKPIFGHGLNSFHASTGGYPHNLVLELWTDIGLIGLFFFIAILILSIQVIFKFTHTPLYVFSVIPLYMIIVQMFSGNLYDFRYWFLWMIPLLFYQTASIKITKREKNINSG